MTATTPRHAPGELPPSQVSNRIPRARQRLKDLAVDALVVTNLANVRYLTGFSGSAGVAVLTDSQALLTTDGRYRTQSAEQLAAAGTGDTVDLEVGGVEHQRKAIADLLGRAGAHRVGLEADHVSWSATRRWAEVLGAQVAELADQGRAQDTAQGVTLVPTSGCVEALREVKDPGEVALMDKAAAIADAALGEVRPLLQAATAQVVTEAQVALELDTAMRRLGAQDRAFDTIVASGPNSAKPHHQPTDRPLEAGDAVVIDFGATYGGYRSDMTRSFCLGGPPQGELARIFAVVGEAQAKGVEAVRSGVAAKEVDEVCREVIRAAGWAEAFEHGTGHGVGLDIHEAPTVSPLGTAILASGVIVTVEPGVYLPGVGGVRIEDTLVVTDDGSRALTNFSKDVVA